MAGLAAILGGVLLSSNVMKHHWSGLTFALLFTLGLSIALPWMTLHQDALFGAWVWVALANFGLIYIALTWGLTAQFAQCATTFAARRESVFEEYSRRKLVQLLGFEAKAAEKTSAFKRFKRTFFHSLQRGGCLLFSFRLSGCQPAVLLELHVHSLPINPSVEWFGRIAAGHLEHRSG